MTSLIKQKSNGYITKKQKRDEGSGSNTVRARSSRERTDEDNLYTHKIIKNCEKKIKEGQSRK